MSFSSRSTHRRLQVLLTILVIGIIFMVNVISIRHFIRLDMTADRLFSIREASQVLLRDLPDIVTAKIYFSHPLPPHLATVRQHLLDVLDEFKVVARDNLQVQLLDPAEEDVAEEARLMGIPSVRMNIFSKDRLEVKSGFLGVALLFGDQVEILPVIQDTRNMEYDLLAAFQKLTSPYVRRIGFLEGHGEYPTASSGLSSDPGERFTLVRQALESHYRVTTLGLTDSEFLQAIDTLIIGGPVSPFSLSEKKILDQYLMRGGNIVMLGEGVSVKDLVAHSMESSLLNLLEPYGVRLTPALIVDPINEVASFQEGLAPVVMPYPFWVKAIKDYFDPDHPITGKLETVVFSWVSPLTIIPSEKVEVTFLVKSSPESSLQEQSFNLLPPVELSLSSQSQSYPIALLLEGIFKTAYPPSKKTRSEFSGADEWRSSSNGRSRILAVGDAQFLTDRMLHQYPQNLHFFLNAMDYLTLGERLSEIRSPEVKARPLIPLSDQERRLLKWGGIFLMPLLVILYGVTRFFKRRHHKMVF